MRVSKSFLSDYIDINDIDFQEIADKMVFAGNEYESIEKISSATNLVVGYILDCQKHPESTKLSICKVDIGDGEHKQILCGAPNVRTGQKVIVAKVGATLPGGITIGKAKLAGLKSEGMICSLAELGIESKYLSEEDKNGIHVFPDDAPIGEDAIKYLRYDDEVIDFDLTANRGDLLSILGMAYEIGTLYNKKVKEPNVDVEEIDEDIHDTRRLKVLTDKCSIYLGKLVKNIVIKESPRFIQTRLMASGIRPINNVVDISNYVMLEFGQPLHFFDADKLVKNVYVRMAEENEKITTLDGIERTLSSNDIVIADDNGPVALAGVMGGLSTEVTEETKNIFIEAAIFHPYNIRHTSKRILRSESSMRYEKGIDSARTLLAIKRACYLLNKYASGEVVSGILTHDVTDKSDKKITITIDKINNVLGMQLDKDTIADVFDRLQFKYTIDKNTFTVLVPTRRLDVNIKEDLIEEVGRIVGYDNVKGILPITSIKRGSYLPKTEFIKNVRKRLTSLGLNEVITYSLISEQDSDKFIKETYEKVILNNPMSEDRKIMRNSLIPSLIEVYHYNSSRNIKDVNIFEIGSCYSKVNENYVEEAKVSGLLYGNYFINDWQHNIIKVDFYVLKGIIENLLKYLGLANRYNFSNQDLIKDLHPGRSANIIVDNEIIGYLGQIHPNINKKEIYVFELSLDKLMNKRVRNIKFKEIPKYPSINKDVAFIVNKNISSIDIEKVIKKVSGRLLTEVNVFDVYEGENIGKDKKSIAYSLTFQDPNKTLTDEEVTVIFNKIIEEVKKQIGGEVRDK